MMREKKCCGVPSLWQKARVPDEHPLPPVSTAPEIPATPPASGAPTQPAPTGGVAGQLDLAEKLLRSSAGAVDQFLGESKKRRGERGPDKRPRAKKAVPVAQMGGSTDDALLAEGAPAPLGGVLVEPAPFDEETARQVIEIGIGLLNDGASAIVRAIAKKETGDEKLAESAAKEVRMTEKIDACVRLGALQCAKKYAVRMEYAPELMLGGGLVIWAGQVAMSVRTLRAAGAALRETPPPKP